MLFHEESGDSQSRYRKSVVAALDILTTSTLRMAADRVLAFFSCQCRVIKFYDLSDIGARQRDGVILVREPHNPRDSDCLAVFLGGGGFLGHVAKEAAEWLSPMLLGPFRITG